MGAFADLLASPGVEELCDLRSSFGFMAYHGGGLEEMTDVIAKEAAIRCGASFYGVRQPGDLRLHIPSTRIDPAESPLLGGFLAHVTTVITVHGYGRRGLFTSLLLGGRNRALAEHVGTHLRSRLPAYEIVTDLQSIPRDLRGLHPANPVNLPTHAGVQVELPPRVRGTSPLWWDWEGPGPTPHAQALIDGLVSAERNWAAASH